MKKFIFPLTEEGLQVILETDNLEEAYEEYRKLKEEVKSIKIKVLKIPKKKTIKKGIYEHLLELKEEGFFSTPKTIGEIKDKLAELAVHKPLTSFPPYLNPLVNEKILKRNKQERNGRKVWVYENGN